jgi:hypothetical protein
MRGFAMRLRARRQEGHGSRQENTTQKYDADLAKRDVTGDLPDLRLAFLDFDPIRRGGREQGGATAGGDASA